MNQLFDEEEIQQIEKFINDRKDGNPSKTKGQECGQTQQPEFVDVIRLQFHERKQAAKPSGNENYPYGAQQHQHCDEGEYSKNGPSGKRNVSSVRDSRWI